MSMDQIAREWLAARNVIATFLREVAPAWPTETIEHNAAAILARLASHDPPILIHTAAEDALTEAAPELLAIAKRLWSDRNAQDSDQDALRRLYNAWRDLGETIARIET